MYEIEMFKWIREKNGVYDLASSGVLKLEAPQAEAPPLEEVLIELYDIPRQNLAIVSGAQEGNFLAFLAVKPEYAVITVPEYEPIIKLPSSLGVRHVKVWDVWEAPIKPGGVLIFSNPNNPTGRYLEKRELAELADEARRKGAYLIIDIIFSDFVTDDLRGFPLENVAYSHSTDKFYTHDLRAGWVFGDEEIVRRVKYLKDLANPGPREAERKAAAALLSRRAEVKRRNLSIIKPNATALLTRFPNALYKPHMPIALIPTGCNDAKLAERLLAMGVKTVPGRLFQAPYSIRVGLGVEEPPRFREALEILAQGWCRA
ncbi:aminotransferase, putative [Pyrobaculum aerophilum str. IM2]|uniref:Aminotransferase, putative n=2 Tax=Pyrobaculum aerophilum TaxID=13773 RepID=Q8ZSP4_PYRAE|nr:MULTISPECIES: pyridoxal phosphate-dependent aminotransferase [Pyrobaculum]AAL65069.1 aminotransferase, putative [Pyrobaculum aerophilum str. IM2]